MMSFDKVDERLIRYVGDRINEEQSILLTLDQLKAIINGQSIAIKSAIEIGIPIRLPYCGRFILKEQVSIDIQNDTRADGKGSVDKLNLMEDDEIAHRAIMAKIKEAHRHIDTLKYSVPITEMTTASFIKELNYDSTKVTNKLRKVRRI